MTITTETIAKVSSQWITAKGNVLEVSYALVAEQTQDDFVGRVGPQTMSIVCEASIDGQKCPGINQVQPLRKAQGPIVASCGQIGLTAAKRDELLALRGSLESHPAYMQYCDEQAARQTAASADRSRYDRSTRAIDTAMRAGE